MKKSSQQYEAFMAQDYIEKGYYEDDWNNFFMHILRSIHLVKSYKAYHT